VLTDPGGLESPVSGRQIAVEVIDRRRRILARSLTLGADLLPQDALFRRALLAGQTGYENVHVGSRRFRLFAAPIADAGGPAAGGVVLVASDYSDISDTINHLGVVLAVAGAAAAMLAALIVAALTRRGLRQLGRLAAAAEEIERTGDPARRLPLPAGSGRGEAAPAAELAQLTGVLNRMLDSLERSRASERRFLADASHELRTPVTTLLGNVEYAVRHGADSEVLAELRRDAGRLARLVDDLLALEREGTGPHEPQPVALEPLIRGVVEDLDGVDDRLRLGRVEAVTVPGEEDALRRLLRNLIDNALVHGPAYGTVTVELTADAGHAWMTVRDEGPGPDPAQLERLFERFWRGADSHERPGSGLGLSIVAAIVRRHGGEVRVAGSAFVVELPRG
jgi:signal transduction histidine kinase